MSGAFIPVSSDMAMIRAVQAGNLSLETKAMTAVCSVGLDMIAIPVIHLLQQLQALLPMKPR